MKKSTCGLLFKRDGYIYLPTFLHKEYAIKAAREGKNILCEKPIALTTEDADEMKVG